MKIYKSHSDNGIKCADTYEITSREVESIIAAKSAVINLVAMAQNAIENESYEQAFDYLKRIKQATRDINLKVTE